MELTSSTSQKYIGLLVVGSVNNQSRQGFIGYRIQLCSNRNGYHWDNSDNSWDIRLGPSGVLSSMAGKSES